jgi:hypothetical protein
MMLHARSHRKEKNYLEQTVYSNFKNKLTGGKAMLRNAEQFRQVLAGLAATEIGGNMAEHMKPQAVAMIKAFRDVFGKSLDRMTLWERIANGIEVAAKKSGGRGDKFIAAMLDYLRSDTNVVVGSAALKAAVDRLLDDSPGGQRNFINYCYEYRQLLCLEVRNDIQNERQNIENVMAQTGAKEAKLSPDGSIITRG